MQVLYCTILYYTPLTGSCPRYYTTLILYSYSYYTHTPLTGSCPFAAGFDLDDDDDDDDDDDGDDDGGGIDLCDDLEGEAAMDDGVDAADGAGADGDVAVEDAADVAADAAIDEEEEEEEEEDHWALLDPHAFASKSQHKPYRKAVTFRPPKAVKAINSTDCDGPLMQVLLIACY
jgi:hypothetical protein